MCVEFESIVLFFWSNKCFRLQLPVHSSDHRPPGAVVRSPVPPLTRGLMGKRDLVQGIKWSGSWSSTVIHSFVNGWVRLGCLLFPSLDAVKWKMSTDWVTPKFKSIQIGYNKIEWDFEELQCSDRPRLSYFNTTDRDTGSFSS